MATVPVNERSASLEPSGMLRLTTNETSRGPFWTGDFLHRRGIVAILLQGPAPGWPKGYTRIDTVIGGRLVTRSWNRQWGRRSLFRLCRELLEVRP